MSEVKAGRRNIEITHPGKVLFPDEGLTKKDVAEYYQKIAGHILPWLEGRPLVMHRYPEGINDKSFYQKDTPDYFPDWIKTIRVDVRGKGKSEESLVNCDKEETLVYIVNQGSITPHVWLSREKNLDRPDRMIFDLDPPEGNFDLVRKGAQDLKDLLDQLGMTAYLMTTGSKGVHVVIPLDEKNTFDDSREFASSIAHWMASEHPDRYTTETRKDKRKGRLFIDYLRNAYGQTGVAPYSLRARKGAPVATPLDWDEIGKSEITAVSYNYANIFRRLAGKDDPWKDFYRHKTGLKKARERFEKIQEKRTD